MGSSTSDYLQLSLLDHSNSVGSESENEKKKRREKKVCSEDACCEVTSSVQC